MKSVYVIAEAGVNHNGDVELARQLIDAAKAAKADAVKFQTFKTEKILTRTARMADYQKDNLGFEDTQFQMIKALELSHAHFAELQTHAESIGIDFLSTPDDEDSLDFLADTLDLAWLKIGSGEVSNLPFLRRIAAKQKPMILSTGMSTIGEVERAVRTIRELNQQELLLLHCTTNYPCPPEEVNLRAMLTLQRAFAARVGYSDHTIGSEVPVAAVALGAEMIEKHITLDKRMEGPDHRASLDPVEFGEMVRQIRAIEVALGNGVKWPNPSEEKIKQLVRRRVVAAQDLEAGTVLAWEHLAFKRADVGIFVEQVDYLIGSRLKYVLLEDTPLSWSHVVDLQFANDAMSQDKPTFSSRLQKTQITPPNINVTLTAATPADIDFLFDLKCEPESIRWGGFVQAPLYQVLKQHYERVLCEGVQTVLIIRVYGERAGVISYSLNDGGDCVDYSINLSSRFSGQGAGLAALKQSIAMLSMPGSLCRRVIALIREDNERSKRIFKAAGFELTDAFEDRFLGSDANPVRLHAWVKPLV